MRTPIRTFTGRRSRPCRMPQQLTARAGRSATGGHGRARDVQPRPALRAQDLLPGHACVGTSKPRALVVVWVRRLLIRAMGKDGGIRYRPSCATLPLSSLPLPLLYAVCWLEQHGAGCALRRCAVRVSQYCDVGDSVLWIPREVLPIINTVFPPSRSEPHERHIKTPSPHTWSSLEGLHN